MSPAIVPELFNSFVEIHSAQLGALLGLFVGLCYRDRPLLAYLLLFAGVLSAFGNAAHIGYASEITTKPWYFLSALYVVTIANVLLIRYAAVWRRPFAALRAAAGFAGRSDADDGLVSDDRL